MNEMNVYSQIITPVTDSLISLNYTSTNFENNINASYLTTKINFRKDFRKFNFHISNNFNSDVSKFAEKYYRDLNNLKLTVNYKVSDMFYSGAGVESNFLSDDRNIEINKNRNNFYFANLEVFPFERIRVNSKLGYKTEDQIGEYNTGFGANLLAEVKDLNISEYISNGFLRFLYEKLSPKVNYNYELNTDIYKNFSFIAENRGIFKAYTVRNDYYIPSSTTILNTYGVHNNIQSRVENSIYLGDNLKYFVFKNLNIGITGIFSTRGIAKEYKYKLPKGSSILENIYDSKIIENRIEISGRIEYLGYKLSSYLQATYYEKSENHSLINTDNLSNAQLTEFERIENDKNNFSQISSLMFETIYNLSNTNSFKLSTSSSILRYNTDSRENFDDRDEIYFIGLLAHRYTNLRNFEIETSFELNRSHLSYLFKERSSNNYVNKIYKLTSKNIFSPLKNLTTINSFQVLANYTVYDFEDLISEVQSFSFRQLNLKDSIFYNITENIFINFYSDLRYYEQGVYNDNNFSVRPVTYYSEGRIYAEAGFMIKDFLRISTGYDYFSQKRYEYDNGQKILKRTIESYGPAMRFQLFLNRKSRIDISGGIQKLITNDGSVMKSQGTFNINIFWVI